MRPGGPPWRTGEALQYEFAVMGMVKAGAVTLEVGRPMFDGTQIPLRARVRNSSVFAKIRRITGGAFSWVDARTLLPERYRDEVVEDGVKKVSDAHLRRDPRAVAIETQYGDERGSTTFERGGEVLDAVSGAYYLRAARLEAGDELCFDLVANRRYWRFRGKVAAQPERVETPAGIFDTVRIEATVSRPDAPGSRRPLHVWISTGPRREMVAAASEIDLGPISLTLARAP